MSANDEQVRLLITHQAADWFIANRAGLNRSGREAFAAWLQASPLHVEEYLSVAVIGRDLRAACADSPETLEALVSRAQSEPDPPAELPWARRPERAPAPVAPRWKLATLVVAAVTILAIGSVIWTLQWRRPEATPEAVAVLHFATRHGEQQTHTLDDDSVLHLNTDSVVTVRYDKSERRVTLSAGEAFFEVKHDPVRKFRVVTECAQIVDLGTLFNVRTAEHSTVVTVLQGVVAVGPQRRQEQPPLVSAQGASAAMVRVTAGEQLEIQDNQKAMPSAEAADPQRAAAWLHRQIRFEREPLQRVAAEFNRYAPKPIEIVTPALQDLQISGVFATDDTEAFIAFLRSLDGVVVEVKSTQIRVSQR